MYDDNAHFEYRLWIICLFSFPWGLSLFAFMWMTPRKDSAFRLRHLALSFLFAIYMSFAQKKELSNIYLSFAYIAAYIAALSYASQVTVTLQVTVWQNRVSNSLLKIQQFSRPSFSTQIPFKQFQVEGEQPQTRPYWYLHINLSKETRLQESTPFSPWARAKNLADWYHLGALNATMFFG